MVIQFVDALFTVYMMMLMARIIGSWFPDYRDHPLMRFVSYYTDPYLNAFRAIIPPLGMLDLSPLVAFFALNILETIVKAIIR